MPEIVFDQLVLNGEDGSLAVELETPTSPYNTPVAADLDQDGRPDVVTVSGFNDVMDPAAVWLMAWMNDGQGRFRPGLRHHLESAIGRDCPRARPGDVPEQ